MSSNDFDPSAVISALHREHLIPDILPSTLSAADVGKALTISFPSGAEVKLGNELQVPDTQARPRVEFAADDARTYTLVMLDPDAPTREGPIYRSFRHWVVRTRASGNRLIDLIGEIAAWIGGETGAGCCGRGRNAVASARPASSVWCTPLQYVTSRTLIL